MIIPESINQQVTRQFDEKKEILATKHDISGLRIELERGFKDNLKWTIATLLVVAGLIIAAIKFL